MFDLEASSYAQLRPARDAYLTRTSAPLDGMWENAFLPSAKFWSLQTEGRAVGYCAINAENALLGFEVFEEVLAAAAFAHCLDALKVKAACASTAEPAYLCLCMDHQTDVTVNALMYEDDGSPADPAHFAQDLAFKQIEQSEHDRAIEFGIDAIGADRGWLTGYYAERIAKEELFGLWRGNDLIAAGELRLSPNQKAVADVGMIVARAQRKQGVATKILQQLRHIGRQRGRRLICSTEQTNKAAQTAISRAGFQSAHRILQFEFGHTPN